MNNIAAFKKYAKIFLSFVFSVSVGIFCSNIVWSADRTNFSEYPIEVKAFVDKETITIGDKIRYTIKVVAPKETEIKLPDFGEHLGGFAVKDFGMDERSFFGKKYITHYYILDTYLTGTYTIPETVVEFKDEKADLWEDVPVPELSVEVESLLEEDIQEVDIKDIENPRSLPGTMQFVWYVLGILFVGAFLVLAFYYVRKHLRRETEEVRRPAHEIAYEALALLRKRKLSTEEDIKEYYSELSRIVRVYLENRFFIRAPEMTTEEFFVHVRDIDALKAEHTELLKNFLVHCDMVKFAKYGPAPDEIKKSYDSASELIAQTKEQSIEETQKAQEEDDF